jgi:single-stranded DNA-binding protein
VEGRLRTREFEAKDNGQKRQRTEIVAARVHFLGAPPTEHAETTEVEDAPILPPEDVPF